MTDTNKVLKVVSRTDKAMASGIGDTQAMLKQSINRLEKRIMGLYNDLEVTKGGNLVGPRVNLKQAQSIHQDLTNLFEEEYGKGARRAVAGYNNVAKLIQGEFKEFDIAATYTKVDRDMINTLKEQAYTEYVQFGTNAQERIAQAMYDTVAGGGSFAELLAVTRGILQGGVDARGRSMAAYATQWANDGVMNFHQNVTLKKAKDASLITFLYYGDVMTTSRQFCIDRVGKVYSKKQIESWDGISWAGKSGPPLTYRGGYNCRHHWHPIKKDWVPGGEIPIQDIYKEQGIEIPRGGTIPAWPVKGSGKVNKKPGKPKPKPKGGDKYDRWVPDGTNTAEADAWAENIFQQGQRYSDEKGIGPCGPVADNIAEYLQGQGRWGRVMYCGYDDDFPHYVAVELDEADEVIRLWDPTNPYVIPKNRILKLKPGQKPKIYFKESYEYGPAQVMDKGEWARDDALYAMDDHQWWRGKLQKPKVAKAMPKPKPPEPPKFVPAKTKKEAEAVALQHMRRGYHDGYQKVTTGIEKNKPSVRFSHPGTPNKGGVTGKHRWVRENLYGKVRNIKKLDLKPMNAVNETMVDIQQTCQNLGIPRLRGMFVRKSADAAASMGDGVLELNYAITNRYWRGWSDEDFKQAEEQLTKVVAHLDKKVKRLAKNKHGDWREGLAPDQAMADWEYYSKKLKRKKEELAGIKKGQIKGDMVSEWKHGDSYPARPFSARSYYEFENQRLNNTLWHETGHHIHQQLFVNGYYDYHSPWMEGWLRDFRKWAGRAASRSGDKDADEWFAENYALWKNGKRDMVTPRAKKFFTYLQKVEDGKATIPDLQAKMAGGDFKK